MKFVVREGMVVHDTRLVEIGGKRQEQTNSYYEGDQVDFDEATASKHLHKLEPVDKAAQSFATSRVAQVSPPLQPAGAGITPEQLQALLAAAYAQGAAAVQAAAVQTPAPAAPEGGKGG
jgi:hypothetical protein